MAQKSMKAVQVSPAGAVHLVDVPVPQPLPEEAVIRVERAGVCNTDLEIIKGYSGMQGIIGHEFVGTITKFSDETSDKKGLRVGHRIVGEINLACKRCATCSQGGIAQRNHCENRSVLGIVKKDGCFAEYITLPVRNLIRVPDCIPSRAAVFVEPLAAAFRIMEQITFLENQKVAVIGDGKLGLLITRVIGISCVQHKCLFGKYSQKMALAHSSFNKHLVTDTTALQFADTYDVTIEASGSPSGIMLAASITKALGTVVLKTTCAAGAQNFNTAPFVVKELVVVGSRCGNFSMALEALQSGSVEVESLIEKEYHFRNALEAIGHAGKRGASKVQLIMHA